MTIMERLTGAFENRSKSDTENYWIALADDDASPDLIMSLADRLNKSMSDIKIDHDLLLELRQCPKVDVSKAEKAAQRELKKAGEIHAKSEQMILQAKSLAQEADQLRDAARYTREQATALSSRHQQIIRKLAQRGHPEHTARVHSIDEAKTKERQAKKDAKRIRDLQVQLKNLNKALSSELEKPQARQYGTIVSELRGKIKMAERELQSLGDGD